jgi:hypothetical protein
MDAMQLLSMLALQQQLQTSRATQNPMQATAQQGGVAANRLNAAGATGTNQATTAAQGQSESKFSDPVQSVETFRNFVTNFNANQQIQASDAEPLKEFLAFMVQPENGATFQKMLATFMQDSRNNPQTLLLTLKSMQASQGEESDLGKLLGAFITKCEAFITAQQQPPMAAAAYESGGGGGGGSSYSDGGSYYTEGSSAGYDGGGSSYYASDYGSSYAPSRSYEPAYGSYGSYSPSSTPSTSQAPAAAAGNTAAPANTQGTQQASGTALNNTAEASNPATTLVPVGEFQTQDANGNVVTQVIYTTQEAAEQALANADNPNASQQMVEVVINGQPMQITQAELAALQQAQAATQQEPAATAPAAANTQAPATAPAAQASRLSDEEVQEKAQGLYDSFYKDGIMGWGWGTDEQKTLEILKPLNAAELKAVRESFENLAENTSGTSLDSALEAELKAGDGNPFAGHEETYEYIRLLGTAKEPQEQAAIVQEYLTNTEGREGLGNPPMNKAVIDFFNSDAVKSDKDFEAFAQAYESGEGEDKRSLEADVKAWRETCNLSAPVKHDGQAIEDRVHARNQAKQIQAATSPATGTSGNNQTQLNQGTSTSESQGSQTSSDTGSSSGSGNGQAGQTSEGSGTSSGTGSSSGASNSDGLPRQETLTLDDKAKK